MTDNSTGLDASEQRRQQSLPNPPAPLLPVPTRAQTHDATLLSVASLPRTSPASTTPSDERATTQSPTGLDCETSDSQSGGGTLLDSSTRSTTLQLNAVISSNGSAVLRRPTMNTVLDSDQTVLDTCAPSGGQAILSGSGEASSSLEKVDFNKFLPADSTSTKKKLGLTERLRKHWKIFCACVLVILVSVSIPVGWVIRLHSFDGTAIPDDGANLALDANLVTIDPDQRILTMEWWISQYNCTNYPCEDVNLYFDQNLLNNGMNSNSNQPPTNGIASEPVFFLNGSMWNTNLDHNPYASLATFRTDIALTTYWGGRSLQSYPFDEYTAQIFMFANSSSGIVPVGIYWTGGIAVGFNAQLSLNNTFVGDGNTLVVTINVTRGTVVRVYSLFIVLAVWLVTLTLVAACISAVFLKRRLSATVLVVPIATLFAFTQLRGSLPGAPAGFGADIDFVGILPCLAILTFCSVFMTSVFLFRDPEKGVDPEKDE